MKQIGLRKKLPRAIPILTYASYAIFVLMVFLTFYLAGDLSGQAFPDWIIFIGGYSCLSSVLFFLFRRELKTLAIFLSTAEFNGELLAIMSKRIYEFWARVFNCVGRGIIGLGTIALYVAGFSLIVYLFDDMKPTSIIIVLLIILIFK